MKNFYLLILLLIVAKTVSAQTSNLDELPLPILRQKLVASKNDTNTVQLQLAIGHLMLLKGKVGPKEIDSAIRFAAEATVLSHRLNYDFGIINAMLLSAETFYSRNDRETGLKIAQNALTFSKIHNNLDGQARSYHLIAQYYPTTYPAAIRNRIFYINKAIAIFRKDGNTQLLSFLLTKNAELLFEEEQTTEGLKLLFEALNLGKSVSRRTVEGIYWNIGRASMSLGDYTNSLKYDLLALKTASEVKDTTMQVGFIKHLIASTYIKIEDYEKAIPYSIEVLRMAKRYNETYFINTESSALASEYTHTNKLSQALTILNEMKSKAHSDLDKLSVSVGFLNSLIYAKHFVQAGKYVKEVKEHLAGIPTQNVTELMNAYNSLASYYSETDQVKLAYHYTELYAAMAHKLNYTEGVTMAENRYYRLVTLQADPKSVIGHFLKEQKIKDSTDHIVKAYQIFVLDMENETMGKNRHIDSLTMDAQIKEIKLKRNQLIQKVTICGSAMLLIVTGLIYSRYRLKQRSNALLTLQKEEIDHKNNALQQLIMDKNDLLEDKDELLLEKDLLLKEVNHRVKNNLQIVMSLLQSQSGYMQNKKAQEAILESQNRVKSIALIHDQLFQTDKIAEIDITSYVRELISALDYSINEGNGQVAIKYSLDEIKLDVSQAIPVGIILNEAVTNALKYAFPEERAGEIMVTVKHIDQHIEMQVSDNGGGLPADFNLSSTNSLGITLIRGLTGQLKGRFKIEGHTGVTVTVKFPVEIPPIKSVTDILTTEEV